MLELADIAKSFGGRVIIESVTLSLKAGEVICLVGPSGIGKTTLLEIAAGVTRPDAGTVTRGARASLMFQDDVLIPWLTAEEAVTYVLPAAMPEKDRHDRAVTWLRRFGLEDAAYPAAMSGGMRRRLSMARAFAAGRPLLLLDEPFTFLDPERCRTVAETIALHAREGGGVMLTSHVTDVLQTPALAGVPLKVIPVESSPVVLFGT